MNTNLNRLVYYSKNRIIGEPKELSLSIASILSTSRTKNAEVGVTGALMFNAGCFAQVLEGPQHAVEAVFERIQQDERHGDVSLLAFEPVQFRFFGDWSMGFVGAKPNDADVYGDLTEQGGFDATRMTGDELLSVLYRLALQEENPKY
ncbi:blue light sensor protein [Altererythrobacter xixiisoli]|uniref:Blue light sensor protein n=1 Tax=Croceibacterium xixiisoli TaxID=1476466 RepID=A0A6I4TXM2_9SPHN|nr:BLUF domain-containing protein [Croceibacterium xixiisoli]MXP00777.1 blue light sensor protein [Croceibacterium xixiisoli]